jgi:hypothetical protein
MSQDKVKAMLASYVRSVVGAAAALYAAGITDPKDLVYALFGALIPVAARYVNPNDPAFGRIPTESEVEEALKKAKAPAKKVTKK